MLRAGAQFSVVIAAANDQTFHPYDVVVLHDRGWVSESQMQEIADEMGETNAEFARNLHLTPLPKWPLQKAMDCPRFRIVIPDGSLRMPLDAPTPIAEFADGDELRLLRELEPDTWEMLAVTATDRVQPGDILFLHCQSWFDTVRHLPLGPRIDLKRVEYLQGDDRWLVDLVTTLSGGWAPQWEFESGDQIRLRRLPRPVVHIVGEAIRETVELPEGLTLSVHAAVGYARTLRIEKTKPRFATLTRLLFRRVDTLGFSAFAQPVRGNDILKVPVQKLWPIRIHMSGNVMQPGLLVIPSGEPATLYATLVHRGGFSRRVKEVHVLRKMADGQRERIVLNIRSVKQGLIHDFVLRDSDVVHVPEKFFSWGFD